MSSEKFIFRGEGLAPLPDLSPGGGASHPHTSPSPPNKPSGYAPAIHRIAPRFTPITTLLLAMTIRIVPVGVIRDLYPPKLPCTVPQRDRTARATSSQMSVRGCKRPTVPFVTWICYTCITTYSAVHCRCVSGGRMPPSKQSPI